MPKGGARSRSGPPPDPNALRRLRKDDAGWTILPAEGRSEPAPEWPLPTASERELQLWEEWWASPVAVLWERAQAIYDVACAVRLNVETEAPKARVEDRKTAKQHRADLYLTPDSQLRARIRIASDEVAEKREQVEPTHRPSARDRLKVVDGRGA